MSSEQQNLDWTVGTLTKDHIQEMEKYSTYAKEETQQHWDELAHNYEGVYNRAGYSDPEKVAEQVLYFASGFPQKADVKILDFACGTGLVGEQLKRFGFENIEGVDISNNMLNIAKTKKCYSNLENLELGQEKFLVSYPPALRQKFDFLTCAGLINNNHMDEKIFEQMLLSLKEGGIMVFAARFSYLGNYWYNEKLEKLEKLGRIKLLKESEFFKYDNMSETVGKFTKTPVKVFAFQKTESDSVMGFQKARQAEILETFKSHLRAKLLKTKLVRKKIPVSEESAKPSFNLAG